MLVRYLTLYSKYSIMILQYSHNITRILRNTYVYFCSLCSGKILCHLLGINSDAAIYHNDLRWPNQHRTHAVRSRDCYFMHRVQKNLETLDFFAPGHKRETYNIPRTLSYYTMQMVTSKVACDIAQLYCDFYGCD